MKIALIVTVLFALVFGENTKRLLVGDSQVLQNQQTIQQLVGRVTALEAENAKNKQTTQRISVLEAENVQNKQAIQLLSAKATALETENVKLKSTQGTAGVVFTVWGRKSCPANNHTRLVYSGIAGGSYFDHKGAAADYLCLPHNPDLNPPNKYPLPYGLAYAEVWGSEYENNFGKSSIYENDVPCAVCLDIKHNTQLMLPGKNTCNQDWTLQYQGILCGGAAYQPAASSYVCLHNDMEVLERGSADQNGKLFYPALTICGSLPCPPYTNATVLKCAVCVM